MSGSSPLSSSRHLTLKIAVAVIHDEEGRFLLVRKTGTQWFMQPGGKIGAGETPEGALKRELQEELGLECELDDLHFVSKCTASAANEPGSIVEADVFMLKASFPAQPRCEIAEARWVTRAQATALPLAELTRDDIIPLMETIHDSQ